MLLKLLVGQIALATILYINSAEAATDKVICYYESWASGSYPPEDVDVNICTHINFSFMGINGDGSLRMDGGDGIIKRLAALKSKNRNLKILLSVGGWSEGSATFSQVAADAGKKNKFAQSCLEHLRKYKLDGIDIDWEYPSQRDGSNKADKENFIDMLWVLRNAFNAAGGFLITIASSSDPAGNSYNVNAISKVVDAINVMTYDFHSASDGKTGQNSPLYASSSDSDWERTHANCDASINNWLNAGASPDKLVLGLGFYGHAFKLANANNHGVGAKTSGEGSHGGGYNQICKLNSGWTEVWDDQQQVPYKYSGDQWVGYDNPRSIALKVQYAKKRNLGGVMMWAVDNDDRTGACGPKNALLQEIKKNL